MMKHVHVQKILMRGLSKDHMYCTVCSLFCIKLTTKTNSVIASLFGYHYLVLYQDVLWIEAILFQYLFLYHGFYKICNSLDRWRGTECLNYIHSHFRGRFLDILGYLNNAHKNPKFGRVRQVPIWHGNLVGNSLVGTCLTLPNLEFLWVFFKYPNISKNGNPLFFPVRLGK